MSELAIRQVPVSKELEVHKQVKERDLKEIDGRIAAGYTVAVLWGKQNKADKFVLVVEVEDHLPIEVKLQADQIGDALDHPFAYAAFAGIAFTEEELFHPQNQAEAA